MTDLGEIAAIDALTRSGPRQDALLGQSDAPSDEALISRAARADVGPRRMRLLSTLSKLLRLMDGFLVGSEIGERFVTEFTRLWLSVDDWGADPTLERELLELSTFYSKIQLFCAVPEHREEEPLLFGTDRLRELTQTAYTRLKNSWYRSLIRAGT